MISVQTLPFAATPHVSEAALADTLEALIHTSRPRLPNPLDNLFLIDEAMMDAALPKALLTRSYVLSGILTSIISEELVKHRRAFDNVARELEISQKEALDAIKQDVSTYNSRLVAWSWLYYRYVRPDLNISIGLFCDVAGIHHRTLARYRIWATQQLLLRVIERETCARKIHQKRLLYTQLPSMNTVHLFGHAEALKKIDDLTTCANIHHVQVVGAAGIGKTALVQKAVRSLIDKEALDCLVWMERPQTVHEICQRLSCFVQEHEGCDSICEVIQRQRTAFVFDGVEQLWNDLIGLEHMLHELASAVVFLTSRVPLPLRNAMGYIVLPELEQSDARQLIRVLLNNWYIRGHEEVTQDDIQLIWRQAGGNPRRIGEAIRDLQMQ